jgi:predicted acylesterase/phospholipase RssA
MTPRMRYLAIALLSTATGGCGGIERVAPVTATLPPRALIDLDAAPGAYKPYDPQLAIDLLRSGPRASSQGPPTRHVLALSGGGMYGAYSAGVLKGWSASGTRPQFDVVTGISTGSLIAPFAFLGSEYDNFLERRYTSVRASDVYRRRYLSVLWSDSLADSAPLRKLIEAELTDDVLDRIAVAHAQGRRLYVGTTNLDTKRLTVWDMGAIASSTRPGRAELFRSVVLASCSVPGVLPPVSIDVVVDGKHSTELHADGGVTASIFTDIYMLSDARSREAGGPSALAGANVYALVAGKLYPDPGHVQRRLLSVSGQSLATVLQARAEGDLMRLFLLATLSGGKFQLASVPEETPVSVNMLDFDPAIMRKLFQIGYAFTSRGGPWRDTPPGVEPDEQRLPRSGVHFATDPSALPGADTAATSNGPIRR